MGLTRKDVDWVAHLARLELTDEALDRITAQLQAVVAYFDKLTELDTSRVEPLSHPGDVRNVFREDEPGVSLPTEAALRNAPEQADGFFRVPRVIE